MKRIVGKSRRDLVERDVQQLLVFGDATRVVVVGEFVQRIEQTIELADAFISDFPLCRRELIPAKTQFARRIAQVERGVVDFFQLARRDEGVEFGGLRAHVGPGFLSGAKIGGGFLRVRRFHRAMIVRLCEGGQSAQERAAQ